MYIYQVNVIQRHSTSFYVFQRYCEVPHHSTSGTKMSEKLPLESDDAYFRRMVKKHKPVPDRPHLSEPEVSNWQNQFLNYQSTNEESIASSIRLDKPRETGARPKLSRRRSSSEVNSPSEDDSLNEAMFAEVEQPQKWVRQRFSQYTSMGFDLIKQSSGKWTFIAKDFFPRGGVSEDGKQVYISDKYRLYLQLKAMNLNDPETVEKIRKACSSDYKCSDKCCKNKN